MKYCPFCGTGLSDEVIFCPKCGKKYQGIIENNDRLSDTAIEKVFAANENRKKAKRKRKVGRTVAVFAITTIIVGTLLFMLRNNELQQDVKIGSSSKEGSMSGETDNNYEENVSMPEDIQEKEHKSISEVANSVLYLEVFDDEKSVVSTASGFIVGDGSVLVTNYHVVEDAYSIVAWTKDGKKSVNVSTMVAFDKAADVAILLCDEKIGVAPMEFGNSDIAVQGDAIYAAGYPLGLSHTLSDGVISSRYLDENGVDIIQITAAISPGSSGGALLNQDGEVIGVICASYVDGQNLNIAISSDIVCNLLKSNSDPIKLADYYNAQTRVGLSNFNLLQNGGRLTRSGNYVFYTERMKIYCCNTETGITKEIATGQYINAYKDRLYYYDRDAHEIVSSNYDGRERKTVLSSAEISEPYGVSDMLVMDGVLFFTTFNMETFQESFFIYDLSSGVLVDSIDDVGNFAYFNNKLYVSIPSGSIAEIDLTSYEVHLLETSCSPMIRGISKDGKIYYIDEKLYLENGFFYIDVELGEEVCNPNYARHSGNGVGWDLWVVNNSVYLSMRSNGAYETHRLNEDGSLTLINNDIMMTDGGYLSELNYFYSYDGTTIDMETGQPIGVWVFN